MTSGFEVRSLFIPSGTQQWYWPAEDYQLYDSFVVAKRNCITGDGDCDVPGEKKGFQATQSCLNAASDARMAFKGDA